MGARLIHLKGALPFCLISNVHLAKQKSLFFFPFKFKRRVPESWGLASKSQRTHMPQSHKDLFIRRLDVELYQEQIKMI